MYEITIKKITIEDRPSGGKWEIVAECPITREEADKGYGDVDDYKGKMKSVYGHTPVISIPTEVEYEILKQRVEELDLNAVIKAVNGL